MAHPSQRVRLNDLTTTALAISVGMDEEKRWQLVAIVTNIWARMVSREQKTTHSIHSAADETLTVGQMEELMKQPQILFNKPLNRNRWTAFRRVVTVYFDTL